MKLLEVSSPKRSTVSLDLLNLYVVNQISTKKDNTENMRKPVHLDITEDVKTLVRRHNLELPKSPLRAQHKSNLDDLQNRLQKQVLDSRREHLLEKIKYQHNSQVTELAYVDPSVEQEDNTARAFSACPLSSSGFLSSNCTQLSEENFNTNLMGNIWEQIYEEKLQTQLGNSSDQDSWNTKPPRQCIFRKSDTEPQELFEPFHRADRMNSARKNPVIVTSNESEICKGIKEPISGVVKETEELKAPQDGSGCSLLALFEDESQPIYNNLSTKHFNPFVNQSSTDIFFIHSEVGNQTTNRSYPYDTRKAYPTINAKKSSVDRHLEGIFTAPGELFLRSNNPSNTSSEETSGLHKTHLQNCHEGQHCFILCEKTEKHTNLEKIETFAYHHDQQISLKENMKNYSRKNSDDESVKETAWRQTQLFGFEEFTTAQEKESTFGISSSLHEMEKSVESPLSSQSHSYSPRQTESYWSCSSDTSEDEDTGKKKEYLHEQSLKTHDDNFPASREAPKNSQTRTVPLQPSSSLAREEANNLQEKDSIFCAPKENKYHAAPSGGCFLDRALRGEHVTRSTRCDVGCQTERSVTKVEKADVATQCVTLRVCSCGGSVPAARSPGGIPAPGSAAGHELPSREAPQPAGTGSAAGIAAFSAETEYLSLAGRRTLEVLNYIDKIKERDKQ